MKRFEYWWSENRDVPPRLEDPHSDEIFGCTKKTRVRNRRAISCRYFAHCWPELVPPEGALVEVGS
jgi:hypothetical protein